MPQSLKSIASINVGVNNVQSSATWISVTGNIIIENTTPTDPSHATRKDYVDSTTAAFAIVLGI
jgi:hypothetical protein